MTTKWRPNKCCVCGRFVGAGADSSVAFGTYGDTEPPDEEYYCDRCAEAELAYCLANKHIIGAHYRPPRWEIEAAKQLGFVRAGPKAAAWGRWWPKGKVPEGYTVWSN